MRCPDPPRLDASLALAAGLATRGSSGAAREIAQVLLFWFSPSLGPRTENGHMARNLWKSFNSCNSAKSVYGFSQVSPSCPFRMSGCGWRIMPAI